MSSEPLRIVVVTHAPAADAAPLADPASTDPAPAAADELDERDRALRVGLLEAGYRVVATLPPDPFLADRIRQLRADVVIVDARSDARDAVEHVVFATRDDPRPIVMFTDSDDPQLAREAVANGVTAYVVQGLQAGRVRSILQVALARFEREQALRAELAEVRGALADRKLVERAKGLLMSRQGLTEAQAWARIRKLAMDRGVKAVDIARRLIDAAELLS